MTKVGLIVPVYKNFPGFAELMASVDIEVVPIIIDNWRENRGVSKGWNEGLRRAIELKLDAAFIVNDDVVFEAGTMANMLTSLWGHDLVSGYDTRKGFDNPDSPDFACFLVDPIRFVFKFGWFDERFSPAYFEDNDMAYRVKIGGGSYLKCDKSPFTHKGSVTQNWGGVQVVSHSMFENNREYYISKWGGQPGEETFTVPFQHHEEEIGIGIMTANEIRRANGMEER